MYKITSITDREGNEKENFIKEEHPKMLGDFYSYRTLVDSIAHGIEMCCFFVLDEDSNKMLKTSGVQIITEHDNWIRIETRNSIYTFEKVLD